MSLDSDLEERSKQMDSVLEKSAFSSDVPSLSMEELREEFVIS